MPPADIAPKREKGHIPKNVSFFHVRRTLWRKCQAPAPPRAISLPSRYNPRAHSNSFRLRLQHHCCDRRKIRIEHPGGFRTAIVSRCVADHCLHECIVTMRVEGAALAPALVAVPMFEPALLSRLCVSCPMAIHFFAMQSPASFTFLCCRCNACAIVRFSLVRDSVQPTGLQLTHSQCNFLQRQQPL